ncbi:DUF541 domain-containing protein [Patescibacteria group bacterium]|nr:MAG: DUF541 domain-containing protein [Patescibacteria group bacterium]
MNESAVSMFQSKTARVIVGVLGVLICFLVLVKTMHEYRKYTLAGSGTSATNTITVNGESEVFAVPDIATFTYTVNELAKTVPAAQKVATEKANKAVEFLKKSGVAEKDIQTTGYNISPQYDYLSAPCTQYGCPGGKSVFKGYEVSQTVAVKVRKIEDAGTILAGIGELNVTNLSGLQFTVDKENEFVAEARKKAINEAKTKAKILADDLGVSIVRVVSFSEGGDFPRPYYSKALMMDAAVGGMGGGAPEISTGENKITSQVSITYEIR